MRFMMLLKSDERTEAGEMPSEKALEAMGKYNEELADAGVLLAGEGLHPSSEGARVVYTDGERTVTDGPFTEAKELISGFWIIDVESKEEAVEWAERIPLGVGRADPGGVDAQIELRRVFEEEDFGDEFTPELREREEELRKQLAEQG